jgi:hypothetical protein
MCGHQCDEDIGSSLYGIEIDHKTSGACPGAQPLSLNLLTFYQSDENLEKTKKRLTVRRVVIQYEPGFWCN